MDSSAKDKHNQFPRWSHFSYSYKNETRHRTLHLILGWTQSCMLHNWMPCRAFDRTSSDVTLISTSANQARKKRRNSPCGPGPEGLDGALFFSRNIKEGRAISLEGGRIKERCKMGIKGRPGLERWLNG